LQGKGPSNGSLNARGPRGGKRSRNRKGRRISEPCELPRSRESGVENLTRRYGGYDREGERS